MFGGFLALRLCGRAESLSTNPSESHLCFSPTHFWPFSSSLLPNSVSARSWGGTWEAGRGRRKRGNIFLWRFPVVPSVRECFQAWRSCRVFFFLGKYQRASRFFCFGSDWPLRAKRQSLTKLIATRGPVRCEKHRGQEQKYHTSGNRVIV